MAEESPVQTDEDHRRWAHEHLVYEVNTLVAATKAIPRLREGSPEMAFALESWAVHARCLQEFLWRDRDRYVGDAYATDFCEPGAWKAMRGALPPTLAEIAKRKRFGREIVHLTYHRASVQPATKDWMNGKGTVEIVAALDRFAHAARPERLAPETADHLRRVHRELAPTTGGIGAATGPSIETATGGTQAYPGFSSSDLPAGGGRYRT